MRYVSTISNVYIIALIHKGLCWLCLKYSMQAQITDMECGLQTSAHGYSLGHYMHLHMYSRLFPWPLHAPAHIFKTIPLATTCTCTCIQDYSLGHYMHLHMYSRLFPWPLYMHLHMYSRLYPWPLHAPAHVFKTIPLATTCTCTCIQDYSLGHYMHLHVEST